MDRKRVFTLFRNYTSRVLDENSPFELRPRKLPTQQWARDLVDKILDTTANLLDEVGIDGLTTNLIAERAEIRVSSIYRYFPNKHAIMVSLWERMVGRWIAEFDVLLSEWILMLRNYLAEYVSG